MSVILLEEDIRYQFNQLISFGNDLSDSLDTTQKLMTSLKQHGMTDSLKHIFCDNNLLPVDCEVDSVTMSTGVESFGDVLKTIVNTISKYIGMFIKLIKDFINGIRTHLNTKFDASICSDIPYDRLSTVALKSYPWHNVKLFDAAYLTIVDLISTVNVQTLSDLLNNSDKPINLNNDVVNTINNVIVKTIAPFKTLGVELNVDAAKGTFKTNIVKIVVLEKISGTLESLGYLGYDGFDPEIADVINGPSNKRIMNIMLNKISELEAIQKLLNKRNTNAENHSNQYLMDHYTMLLNSITSFLYLCHHIVTVFTTRTEVFAEICKLPKFALMDVKKP